MQQITYQGQNIYNVQYHETFGCYATHEAIILICKQKKKGFYLNHVSRQHQGCKIEMHKHNCTKTR